MKSWPDLELERNLAVTVAGIDEAGRGPLAGPVVAAAVIIPSEFNASGINDSKKLSSLQRDKLYCYITDKCIYGVGVASVSEIEEINILQASLLAMSRAAAVLRAEVGAFLVDGNKAPKIGDVPVHTVIKGDSKSISIAAASIVAKVTRDAIMLDLHNIFPHYLWNKNAGYGTKQHREAILKHGPCEHHRMSFLKNILS